MVYMAEDKVKAVENGTHLSQSNKLIELGEDRLDNVFGDQVRKKESRYSISLSDKMITMERDFEGDFQRPRSFSDASISSGRHAFSKKQQEYLTRECITGMKVFVRRESQLITRTDEHNKHTSSERELRGRCSECLVKPAERVLSLDNLINSTEVNESAPPKPTLPANYRRYLNQQLKIYHETNDKRRHSCANSQESQSKTNDLITKQVESLRKNKVTSQSDPATSNDNVSENRRKPPTGGLRRGRSSVSELPLRSTCILYRHFDAKLQSEVLKKELDTLRTSEHVRKNSETMRQWLSGSRLKSTGDLHVRFADEVTNNESSDLDGDVHKVGIRTLPRQSKSLDLVVEKSRTKSSNKYGEVRHENETTTTRNYPLSGSAIYTQSHNDTSGRLDSSQTAHEAQTRESRGSAYTRSQGQTRSKSATALGRNRDVLIKDNDFKPLEASHENQLSKSASNLRRRQNTITKFNYPSVEQKRDNVRTRYQHSDKINRAESISPGLEDVNRPESAQAISISSQTLDNRSVKAISDNRSDEEKYAALSRSKIVHSKSSSWDLHSSQSIKEPIRSKHDNDHQKRGLVRKPGAQVLSERLKLKFKLDKNAQASSNSGANTVDLDCKTRTHDNDRPYSDSEYIVNKGAKRSNKVPDLRSINSQQGKNKEPNVTQSGSSRHGKIVLRQCRIGSDVVFGLVAVQDGTTETPIKPNGNGYLDGQGLVTIRMIPDDQGRFGFNVKGGADQGMPIIVSRVAPNTPADNAIPRLNEGDQVLFINGRDVSQHTHEQVVLFIRQSRESRSKELNLVVRPNAYSGDDNSDEPDFVYDPETHQISSATSGATSGANALDLSLKLLEESLESGAALAQFEQLYRKKPGMTMNVARLETNVPKNRYRDISPYDQTRVMIKNSTNGDYINANYVNMEIPVSGILNRYIAAQGPLPATCVDFWQMVWEQQSTLVVMLTTKVERGRIKCHQYWPDLYETSDHGQLQITCVKEEESASFAFREFNLTHVESQEERHISHMQYIAWPDHGVPDDPADFLDFVQKVRQKRVGLVEPSIVHCSAGIGRTGVLITMETAMCLIEANQPVYPLSIVRQMRDQRAMLIQTPNQYKFVCEAIIRCYNEGLVKPLPDYQQR